MPHFNLLTFVSACLLSWPILGADTPSAIRIESAQLTLIEQAEVSSSEAGLLRQLLAKEGETVAEGVALAKIDDREAQLIRERASTEVVIAQSLVRNDIKVRYAKLAAAVADAELKRAVESNSKFPKSVSQTEIDRLKLLADKAVLEIEQAGLDQQQAQLALQVKQHDLDRASLALERRTIMAPFPGMVVKWNKQHGEWVEPGTPIMRLIRLDRLRAEAFIASENLPKNLVGRPATLVVESSGDAARQYPGQLVFVSPEADPVNGQVRVWAEIDNSDLSLRPGQTATLIIGPASEGQAK